MYAIFSPSVYEWAVIKRRYCQWNCFYYRFALFFKADPKDIIGDIDDENDDEEDEDEDLPITPPPKLELKRHRLASYGSIKEEAIYSDPKSNGSRASANNSTASVHWNSSTIERQKNLDNWINESELMTLHVVLD